MLFNWNNNWYGVPHFKKPGFSKRLGKYQLHFQSQTGAFGGCENYIVKEIHPGFLSWDLKRVMFNRHFKPR